MRARWGNHTWDVQYGWFQGGTGSRTIWSTHIRTLTSRDVEPDELHDAGRPRVDVHHTERVAIIQLQVQLCAGTNEHHRAFYFRLDDDAPGDTERAAEEVGAGSKDHVADGCVGECTGQAGDGAHHFDPGRQRRR